MMPIAFCEVPLAPASVAVRAAYGLLSDRGIKAMQVPSIFLGESRTRLIQGMVIGAVASMVIGFSWGGWVTGATANKLAADQAGAAVVTVLTPICVEKFMQNGRCARKSGGPAKNHFQLATGPV